MKVSYEISASEVKALIELLEELCRKSGINEVFTKTLLKRLNEKHFK